MGHKSEQTVHQRPIVYGESNEIDGVRQLLNETGLSCKKVTLDSLHIQFETLKIINCDGGEYIVQVKTNQPNLFDILKSIADNLPPNHTIETQENNRGRIEIRVGSFFDLENVEFDEKWADSGFKTLIVVDREREEIATGKKSEGRYYYLSNQESAGRERELFTAKVPTGK